MTQVEDLTITVPAFRAAGRPFGPVRFFQDQEEAIDALMEAHGMNPTETLRQLVDLGLRAAAAQKTKGKKQTA